MQSPHTGLPVPPGLERGNWPDREQWLESGRFAVDLLCRALERDDLSGVEVLDVGCGTKVVKTLLDHSLPIGRYAGVDVGLPVIRWLQANVSDSRFEFHHLDAHNALYNPAGKPLADFDLLPVGPRLFDLICLFSVFTHLAPDDFAAMLRLLRRHAKPEGTLVFSLFLDDPEQPPPYAAVIEEALKSDDPGVRAQMEASIARELRRAESDADPRFVDVLPDRPLAIARYRKDYVLELFQDSGWEIASLHPPERYIQHYLVCRPS